jgi:hypothetical protein
MKGFYLKKSGYAVIAYPLFD